MVMTTAAFAQAPTDVPLPATRTRINFAPGTSAYTLTTYLVNGVSQGYVLQRRGTADDVHYQVGQCERRGARSARFRVDRHVRSSRPVGFLDHQGRRLHRRALRSGLRHLDRIYPPLGSGSQTPVPLPLHRQRIRFAPGSTGYYFPVDLVQGLPTAYVLGISAQQQLYVSTQGNVTVALLDPNDNALQPLMPLAAQWQFAIPQTGDYTLVLMGSGTAWISTNIPALAGPPSPPQAGQRITFAPGADSITIAPNLVPGTGQSFVLRIARGQTFYILTNSGTTFVLYDPQGNQIANATSWGGFAYAIPRDGDYTVTFYGQGQTSITFRIPPLPELH